MGTVAVIGAGASGIIAALTASEGHNVVLLDGNDKCGKKILLTGNGRCNYWNSVIGADMYETDSRNSLEKILTDENLSNVLGSLERLGIYPKIKNGYYYPYSNQATSIREIFEKKIENSSIKFETNFKAEKIFEKDGRFSVVSADGKKISCDKVIIATGSKTYPKTGSDGTGYTLAESMGHSVNMPLPALTGLISSGKFLKDWEKIRCDAGVTLFANGKPVKSDVGEIQLTAKGVSGICVFNVSGVAAKHLYHNDNVEISINFMPHLEEGLYKWLDERCNKLTDMTVEMVLESIFNYKLMFVLLKKAGVTKDSKWQNMNDSQRNALCRAIEDFRIPVTEIESYEKAQVCTGGVPLSQINPHTMESLVKPNVYFAGEILDVDGRCGGYNLAFAFISGYIAGRSM